MAGCLANENVPGAAVAAARAGGFDVAWMSEIGPGSNDSVVLQMAIAQQRVLITLDRDFGWMAFRLGAAASCGVILMRPKLKSPDYVARFVVAVLS
jgi:predicted nuclease of predicted toxin-antitoxin system